MARREGHKKWKDKVPVSDHDKELWLFPGFRVVSQCCVTGGAGAG
jgi:hypothetical protein